jgi:hypothetical protein
MLLVLTVALSACGNAITMSSTDQIVSSVYTAAALTSQAQAQISAPTATPLPVSTATPAPTSIPPTVMPTLIPPTNEPNRNYEPIFLGNSNAPIQVDHSLCNNSAYIDDITIPDGTILAPGDIFIKTWTLKNTGFCTWKDGYTLTPYEGNSMSGETAEIDKSTASGRETKLSIELTAPDAEGTYTGYWILTDNHGYPFGMPFYVQIVVKNE